WIGTTDGLFRITASRASLLHDARRSDHQAVTALFEDQEGNLWFGGSDGIGRLRDSRFVTFSGPEGLPSDIGGPVYVDEENRTWFGPSTGGLYWLKGSLVTKVAVAGLDRDVVYSIAGRQGEIWVGRQRGGLTRVRLAPEAPFRVLSADTFTRLQGLADDGVF